MEKIPQECRDNIVSFLRGKDVKSLVLVSKKYYGFFVASNLRQLWFGGHAGPLSRRLKSLLAVKRMEKHGLIRKLTIFVPVWAVPRRSHFEELGPLLVDSISQLTKLEELTLCTEGWPWDQRNMLCELLKQNGKWWSLKALKIVSSTEILCAVLSLCVPEVLEVVNLAGVSDPQAYAQLVSMYSQTAGQRSLKSLNVSFNQFSITVEEAISRAIEDFPGLTSLGIQGTQYLYTHCCRNVASFFDWLTTMRDLLNGTSIQELWLFFPLEALQSQFVVKCLCEPVDIAIEDPSEEEIEEWYRDQWYHQLIQDMGSACPHIRKLVIVSHLNPLLAFVGTRSPVVAMSIRYEESGSSLWVDEWMFNT